MSSSADPTDRARWSRLEATFDAALELPAEERAAWLDEACAGDDALRRDVEALIAANETGGRRVETLISDAAGKVLESRAASEKIGPYRVVDTIGHGGMGAVYLALRHDQEFEQQVAIKLLHKTLATPELMARFRSERQMLADLNHPNIAHLIDGGTTDDGIPYLVMEYVEGEPIDRYCDRHRLGVRERIDLFRQVCSAIEIAHQNLIVHRDIKPGNILVTREGVPKLLDFGIAKMLVPHPTRGATDLTRFGDRLLTPDHASPEQVVGKPVTTASDTYSLGVLLYELLCGHRPFSVNALSPAQMQNVICETMPEPPSRALGTRPTIDGRRVDEDPKPIAADRGTSPERLRRQLRGDLDTIVLCALRKEPARRYRSVGLFSEDLRRFLRGLPVTAQRDTWTYRASKFVGRNRIGVALAGVLALSLVGFTLVTWVASRTIAQKAEIAEKSIRFFGNAIVQAADPLEHLGAEMTVREMIDGVAAQAERDLRDEPEIRAVLQEQVGRVYHGISQHDKALESLRSALGAREAIDGEGHPNLVGVLNRMGAVLRDDGQLDESADFHNRALGIAVEAHGPVHPDVADSRRHLGETLAQQGEFEAAEAQFRMSLEAFSRLGNPYLTAKADALTPYAMLLRRQGDFDEAEALFRQALAINRLERGEDHPFVAHDLENLALTLQARGDLAAAGPLFEESLAILRRVYKDDDNSTVSLALMNVCRYLNQDGRPDEAEPLCREALAMESRLSGPDHQWTAFNGLELARVLRAQGELAEAATLLERSTDIFARTLGEDHAFHSDALRRLGDLRREQGRSDEGVALLERALDISRRIRDPGHWHIAACQSDLAAAYHAKGDDARARALLAEAIPGLEVALGTDHRLTQQARTRLAAIDRSL